MGARHFVNEAVLGIIHTHSLIGLHYEESRMINVSHCLRKKAQHNFIGQFIESNVRLPNLEHVEQ